MHVDAREHNSHCVGQAWHATEREPGLLPPRPGDESTTYGWMSSARPRSAVPLPALGSVLPSFLEDQDSNLNLEANLDSHDGESSSSNSSSTKADSSSTGEQWLRLW